MRLQLYWQDRRDGERGDKGNADLQRQLELARQTLAVTLGQLQIVVAEADNAVTDGDPQHDPDIAIVQIRPEQSRDDERQQDEHTAHGGRAFLGEQVVFRSVDTDRLALALFRLQPANDAGSEQKTDEECGQHRSAAAKGEIAEQIEDLELVGERGEEIEQHRFALNCHWRHGSRERDSSKRPRSAPCASRVSL